jgi:SAM-dependent methyltransferase
MTRLYSDDAELYDIAFDWDVEEEVDWLLERLDEPRSVLEPGCGSGRMLAPLTRRGVDAIGIDLSPAMVALAERRAPGRAFVADMTDFDLARTFAGAICPINTLAHLSPDELSQHLDALARHLVPEAAYLVQLALFDRPPEGTASNWEATRGDVALRVTWSLEELDLERGVGRDRSRIEVLSGPDAGRVVEETHRMTAYTAERWAARIGASPFQQVAQYDAGRRGARPPVPLGSPGGLMWHELRLRL